MIFGVMLVVVFNWEVYLGDCFWWGGIVYGSVFPCI